MLIFVIFLQTQLARKCKKKYSENAKKGGGDAPELILPETPKLENKTYVPSKFKFLNKRKFHKMTFYWNLYLQ